MLDHLVHLSVTGVLIASLLSLAAVGLSLSFGVARFANVAHPDFMMLGAYATFAYNVVLGWSFWTAAALGILTALVLGVAVAWLAFDRLPVSGNVQLLVVSIGDSQRRSTTSTWTPSSAAASAACRLRETIAPQERIVRCLPGRTILAPWVPPEFAKSTSDFCQ